MDNFPICSDTRGETCFANNHGKCTILMETNFNAECPFFKTKKRINREYHITKQKNGYAEDFFGGEEDDT